MNACMHAEYKLADEIRVFSIFPLRFDFFDYLHPDAYLVAHVELKE